MDPKQIFYEAIVVLMKVGSPILITVMVVGLTISIFQALTQVQEQTLSFLPKLFCVILCTWMMKGFIGEIFLSFSSRMFDAMIK